MVWLLLGALSNIVITKSRMNAQNMHVAPDTRTRTIDNNAKAVTIAPVQNTHQAVAPGFRKIPRSRPPSHMHPKASGEGMQTVGKLPVIGFCEKRSPAAPGA